jgi:GTP-binding protein
MQQLPIIAIVGRPNVGKSTLFNRLAGSRRALVKNDPGVTRDRIVEEMEINGRLFLVIDTAGLDPDADGDLGTAVQEQAMVAVEQADAILFVVDGKAGLLPEDERVAQILRRSDKPLLMAVNKIDQPAQHGQRMAEFYRLGLALEPMAVSAEHGRGVFAALEALIEALPEIIPEPIETEEQGDGAGERLLKVAIVGRPNVGKSSLLNKLLGSERVVVSDVPGTTRDTIDVRLDTDEGPLLLIDTAGIRRPGRRRATQEQVMAILAIRAIERADVVLQLLDASEGVTDQDAKIAGLVRDRGCPTVILLNKWDLMGIDDDKAKASKRLYDEIDRRLGFLNEAPIVAVSAKTGARLSRIFPPVRELAKAAGQEISTSALNRWLKETTKRHPPAMAVRSQSVRRSIKFFYVTQVGTKPPTFVFFCTDPAVIQGSYIRFLENRLREDFALKNTPIRILLRKRTRREDKE